MISQNSVPNSAQKINYFQLWQRANITSELKNSGKPRNAWVF